MNKLLNVRSLIAVILMVPAAGCVAPSIIDQMRESLEGGKAAVVAKGGVLVLELEGVGVEPILTALDRDVHVFEDAIVMDRVVGRSAAAIYVLGRAQEVIAPVMSEGAWRMLEEHGVKVQADEVVSYIVNRKRTGMCPMDEATMKLDDPAAIVGRLRELTRRER